MNTNSELIQAQQFDQLTSLYFERREHNPLMQQSLQAEHGSLYTWLCLVRVESQTDLLELPTEETVSRSFMGSEQTLKQCLEDLASWELIEIVQWDKATQIPTQIRLPIRQQRNRSVKSK